MYVEQIKIVPGDTMLILILLCRLSSGHPAPVPTTVFVRERTEKHPYLTEKVTTEQMRRGELLHLSKTI